MLRQDSSDFAGRPKKAGTLSRNRNTCHQSRMLKLLLRTKLKKGKHSRMYNRRRKGTHSVDFPDPSQERIRPEYGSKVHSIHLRNPRSGSTRISDRSHYTWIRRSTYLYAYMHISSAYMVSLAFYLPRTP